MKRAIVWASAFALLAGILNLSGAAWSQSNQPAASPPHKVGLIDMAHVFKNYKKFEDLREELKAEIAASEDQAKNMQAELGEMQKKLKALKEGSPEYTKAEELMVKKAATFETFRRNASRDFLKQESQIYLKVYNDVSTMVKRYADRYEYTLVIRFNREELDQENPANLLQGMNRQVVYHREEDDITEKVLVQLNKLYPTQGNSGNTVPKTVVKPGTRPN